MDLLTHIKTFKLRQFLYQILHTVMQNVKMSKAKKIYSFSILFSFYLLYNKKIKKKPCYMYCVS